MERGWWLSYEWIKRYVAASHLVLKHNSAALTFDIKKKKETT